MPTPRRRLLPLALALVAVGPACGAGEPTRVEDGRVVVDLDEFSLSPQDIELRPGPVEFRGRNVGAIIHSPAIRRRGRPVAGTGGVLPGGVKTVRVVLRRGDYRLYCAQANHEALGMYGRLRVR